LSHFANIFNFLPASEKIWKFLLLFCSATDSPPKKKTKQQQLKVCGIDKKHNNRCGRRKTSRKQRKLYCNENVARKNRSRRRLTLDTRLVFWTYQFTSNPIKTFMRIFFEMNGMESTMRSYCFIAFSPSYYTFEPNCTLKFLDGRKSHLL
jgi:hypothetical protein